MHEGMRVVRCRRCRQMFAFEKGLPPKCCPKCQRIRDEQYHLIRGIVREMPGITALEAHVLTEVPVETIMQFVNSGKIDTMPMASREDKEFEERIGVLVRNAIEKKRRLDGGEPEYEGFDGTDGLKPEEKTQKQKINWLFK